MATRIDVLISGYATPVQIETRGDNVDNTAVNTNKYMRATGSCSLVRSGGLIVLFDTMGPWERDSLLEKMDQLKIHPDDIQYLICSHSHPDHIGNLNLFSKARKHFVGTSVYSEDLYDLNCFEPIGSTKYKSVSKGTEIDVITYQNYQLNSHLIIEPTPGHTMECISLIVNNCDNYGTVALAGDLFENENDVEDEGIWLGAGSQNADIQRANRSRIYNKVDYILPGHGPLFKTNRPINF